MTAVALSNSEIYFILFNKSSGACTKLDDMNITDIETMTYQCKVIEEAWSISSNIRNETNMFPIYERFIEWGCKFSSKIILLNGPVDIVDTVMHFMTLMYECLPTSSHIITTSMFDQQTLMLLFGKLDSNSHMAPKTYINVFTKLMTFCGKEIVNESLFCKIIAILCNLIRTINNNNVIGDVFEYAGLVLELYVVHLGHKINSIPITNECITLIQIIVQSEKHAIARLYFWWQFICSLEKETLQLMIEDCLIPFLTNLFGQYMTLDKDKRFIYNASQYNCFTHSTELAPLCNFVMSRLLQSIIGSVPRGLPRVTMSLHNLDNDLFKDNLYVEPYIEEFMVAFYYWCRFTSLTSKKMPFHLLRTVFRGFVGRFLSTSDHQAIANNVKVEPDMCHPSLYTIIDKCIAIKTLLETDLVDNDRTANTIFSEHTTLITAIVSSMRLIGPNLIPPATQNARDIFLTLLCDNLSLMKRLMTVSNSDLGTITSDLSGTWLTNSKTLIGLMLRTDCVNRHGFVSDDMALIVQHWFSPLLDYNNGLVARSIDEDDSGTELTETNRSDNSIWTDNIRLWCHFAITIYGEFNGHYFNLNYVKEYKQLVSFVDCLWAPILFLREFDQHSVDLDDYAYICDIHENLYNEFATKANLMANLKRSEWCGEMCVQIVNALSHSGIKLSGRPALLMNFAIRFIRLVVNLCDPIETIGDTDVHYKKNPLWKCIIALSTIFPLFDSSNIRLTLKIISPKNRIFAPEKPASISKTNQYIGDCDSDFSLGLLLSVTEQLIRKIGDNPRFIIEAMDQLSPKIAQMIDIAIGKKDVSSGKVRQKTKKTQHDTDAHIIEHSVVSVLKHIRSACTEDNTLSVLDPIFSKLFSYNQDVISHPTITFIIEYWNVFIMKNEKKLDFKFSDQLIENLKNVKAFCPYLRLPRHLLQKMDTSNDVTPEDNIIVTGDINKKPIFGSFLNKINKMENKKNDEISAISKPKRGRPRGKQSLSRQSSDADYTVIESPPIKRRRLTDHQKEVFSEQRNKFIPTMYNDLDDVPIARLESHDSDFMINAMDVVDNINSLGSTILAEKSLAVIVKGDGSKSLTHNQDMETTNNNDSDLLSSQEKNFVPIQLNQTEVDLDNLPIILNRRSVITENVNNSVMQFSETIVIKDEAKLLTSQEIKKEFVSIQSKQTLVDLDNLPTILNGAVNGDKVIMVDEPIRKPLLERNPYINSVRSPSVTGRSYRMVQMALQNQQKRKVEPPKLALFSAHSEERQRPTGIMRNTWSESKKDARVSFSEPLVHVQSDESSKTDNDENIDGVFLSPVFNRNQSTTDLSPTKNDTEMTVCPSNEFPVTVQSPRMFSVTCSDSQSAEKVRQSMELLNDVFSPIKAKAPKMQFLTEPDVADKSTMTTSTGDDRVLEALRAIQTLNQQSQALNQQSQIQMDQLIEYLCGKQ